MSKEKKGAIIMLLLVGVAVPLIPSSCVIFINIRKVRRKMDRVSREDLLSVHKCRDTLGCAFVRQNK